MSQANEEAMSSTASQSVVAVNGYGRAASRQRLERRTQLAWVTSLTTKLGTLGTQLLAVPMVYRTLGQDGYAAYAAVTSAVSILGALNFGIGGSLVTPLAQAAARGQRQTEGEILRAGLLPLGVICLAALVVILPAIMIIPIPTLLGEVARAHVEGLRPALSVACGLTLVSLPLTLVGNVRQAYQEIHITNLLGAVGSGALFAALIIAARAGAGVAVFVTCFAGIPLAASVLNGWLLLADRRYLLTGWRGYQLWRSRALAADGVRFLLAASAYFLVYQWPVYLMARSRPTATSAAFAVSMQMVLLPLSLVVGIVQPFWGATAEAAARGDVVWVNAQVKRLRRGAAAAGLVIGLIIGIFGEKIVWLWLGRSVELGWSLRLCAGAYLMLAIWEYVHFVLCLGAGLIREGSMMVFARSAGFAVAAPGLIALWGGTGAWLGLTCSVAAYTAWRMPKLIRAFMGTWER